MRPIFERHVDERPLEKRYDWRETSCLDSNASTPQVRQIRRHTLFFSFSSLFVVAFFFVRAQTQRDRRRRLRRRLRFLLRVSFRRYLLGVSLSFKSHFACIETTLPPMTTRYYYGTRRQRRKRRNDEKEPTDEKASSSKNRSLRARTRYINTNICIYIYFFFYETNRQSKERSSRLGSGRSIRIGFR